MAGLFTQFQNPEEIAKFLVTLSPEQLSKVDWNTLYSSRSFLDKAGQDLIAPYEHRAYSRERTQENPWEALSLGVSIPAYQVYKALFGARSDPSLKQVIEAYGGIREGLFSRFPKDNE